LWRPYFGMATGPLGPDDPLDLSGPIDVPDDASALEADRLAYLAELQERGRRQRYVPPPDAPRNAQLWPFLLIFSATVLALMGFVIAFIPQAGQAPSATALGAPIGVEPGTVGGLMPFGTVSIGTIDAPIRDFRPGVIALIPPGPCRTCGATIASVWEQLTAFRLPLLIVGQPGSDLQLNALSAQAGGVTPAVDNTALLPKKATGHVTLYFIHSDGVIGAVLPADPGTQLEPLLRNLAKPGMLVGVNSTP